MNLLLISVDMHRPPFQAESQAKLYAKISTGQAARIPDRYSDELDRVVQAMLTQVVCCTLIFMIIRPLSNLQQMTM